MRIGGALGGCAMGAGAGFRLALDFPAVAVPLKGVVHLHAAGAGRTAGFEGHHGIGFVGTECDGGDVDVHGRQVKIEALAGSQMVNDPLADSFFCVDVLAAGDQAPGGERGGNDGTHFIDYIEPRSQSREP